MKISLKKGFTLIELLVVITIIGILATGAVGIYTSQLQKARDSTRLNDVQALNTALQAIYNDTSEFPDNTEFDDASYGIQKYISVIPGDPKHLKPCGGSVANQYCAYVYNNGVDSNGVADGAYELSTAFENAGNYAATGKAGTDNGSDPNRYEVGTLLAGTTPAAIDTTLTFATAPTTTTQALKGVCHTTTTAAAATATNGTKAWINGNKTAAGDCN